MLLAVLGGGVGPSVTPQILKLAGNGVVNGWIGGWLNGWLAGMILRCLFIISASHFNGC